MTTSKKPAFVQLCANRMVDDYIEPAQHREEVEFYSIYLGEPGNYLWVADFDNAANALNAVSKMVLAFGCEVDRSQYDAVMRTLAPVPKGHPHAALMAEYAKDAAETETPWTRWEFRHGNGEWQPKRNHPEWLVAYQYRRKPEPPKNIMVNGFEVPAPLDDVKIGTKVYVANALSTELCAPVTYGSWHATYLNRKIIHATKEAAVAHAKAMLGIDPST